MADSALVTKFMQAYAGNYTKNRAAYGRIEMIVLHHCAGNMTIDALGRLWQTAGRQGSSHYGVQHGQVGQYVNEADVAWTNSNWAANCFSVTIETANSAGAPGWPVADDTLETLCRLVADIAMRNNLGALVPGKNLCWHQMYASTACPGPYLLGKMQYIADRANAINAGGAGVVLPEKTLYRVQVGAFKVKENALALRDKLEVQKFDGFVKTYGELNRVQLGAFGVKGNADAYLARVQNAGYKDAFIVKEAA